MSEILLVAVGAVALNVYAAALVLLRAPLFGTTLYRPMMVNIGLSLVPAAIATVTILAMLAVAEAASWVWLIWIVIGLGAFAWVLALPNSAYLITELNLSHRHDDEPVPLWYDIVLVLSLAMSGVINALVNIVLVQSAIVLIALPDVARPFSDAFVWLSTALLLPVVGFGIYLGRHLRFNSWDVKHPSSFLKKLREHFAQPRAARTGAGFTLVHAGFLLCMYLVVVAPAIGLFA